MLRLLTVFFLGGCFVSWTADAQRIAGNSTSTCALSKLGEAWCWGANAYGQLGTGDTNSSLVPKRVSRLGLGLTAITTTVGFSTLGGDAGAETCAIDRHHQVWCWGGIYSLNYQVVATPEPTKLFEGESVKAFASSLTQGCLLTTQGEVKCWQAPGAFPERVTGISAPTRQIMTSDDGLRCAVTSTDSLECWGSGYFGDGTDRQFTYDGTPRLIATDVASAALGGSVGCLLLRSGTVKCWGAPQYWVTTSPQGIVTPTATRFTQVYVSPSHQCGLTAEGEALCWGSNDVGQLGDGTTSARATPFEARKVNTSLRFTELALSTRHTCGSTISGAVHCWGFNLEGQFGNNTARYSSVPSKVSIPDAVDDVALGATYTCALTQAGRVWCWGDNLSGFLGDGSQIDRYFPVMAMTPPGIRSISASTESDVCAADTVGATYCWGPLYGSGIATTPVLKQGFESGVSLIEGGRQHTCALMSDSRVKCFGHGSFGQLGNGAAAPSVLPVPVSSLEDLSEIGVGEATSCALRRDGRVYCWGARSYGQTGDGTAMGQESMNVPTQTVNLPPSVSVDAGTSHSCAATAAGDIYCWGSNFYGELGTGTSGYLTNTSTPIRAQMTQLSARVATADRSTCALSRAGEVFCWGWNGRGQLGVGSTIASSQPVRVSMPRAVNIFAGTRHYCAIDFEKSVWCWGSNSWGQLGIGETTSMLTIQASQFISDIRRSINQDALTGSWYEPATSGQGLLLSVTSNFFGPNQALIGGGWFTYDTGATNGAAGQRWYTLSGRADESGKKAILRIYRNLGGQLSAPPITSAVDVGSATLEFASCSKGLLSYTFNDGSGRSGMMPIERAETDCGDAPQYPNEKTGAWFDPATSGQGFLFEISEPLRYFFGAWYTYGVGTPTNPADNGQRWYTLSAANVDPTSSQLQNLGIFETTGGQFDSPNLGVTTRRVGDASIEFFNCATARLSYVFSEGPNAGTQRQISLSRLGAAPPGCSIP